MSAEIEQLKASAYSEFGAGNFKRAAELLLQVESVIGSYDALSNDIAVAQFTAFEGLRRELDDTRRRLTERREIERAKGLLMRLHAISEEEAFSTLRRLAMDKSMTLGEAAGSISSLLQQKVANL